MASLLPPVPPVEDRFRVRYGLHDHGLYRLHRQAGVHPDQQHHRGHVSELRRMTRATSTLWRGRGHTMLVRAQGGG